MAVGPGEVMVVGIVFGTISLSVLTLARMRMRASQQRDQLPDPAVEERLYRIEQAVDAIAIEVERMAESQRFTSRLLSERLPTPEALSGPDRGRP